MIDRLIDHFSSFANHSTIQVEGVQAARAAVLWLDAVVPGPVLSVVGPEGRGGGLHGEPRLGP